MRLNRFVATTTAAVLVLGLGMQNAQADEPDSSLPVPSRAEVSRAAEQAEQGTRAVAAVRAELAMATAEIETAQIAAASAAERWNGARHALEQAEQAAATARTAAGAAAAGVATQREAYSDALVRSYQSAPSLTGVSAMVAADGVSDFVEQRATLDNTVDALEGRYDQFRASATVAELTTAQAERAQERARALAAEAESLRVEAEAAESAAVARAAEVAERRDVLIAESAELQGISVAVARERQEGIERVAAEQAAQARATELESRRLADEAAAKAASEQAEAKKAQRARQKAREQAWEADRRAAEAERAAERPTTRPQGEPDPEPAPSTPAPGKGAAAAIAFAEAQLGEPYVWGGAGPDVWDCSGLTSKAWAAGGKSLPHWSVGQYRATTPITFGDLKAGDLVFWGNSKNPDSIFHVALYVGNGQIIHAPRSGRPVVKESVTYWRTPDFFGRP